MKIYLAGPMTGIPDHNFPKFARYTAGLRAKGYEVVSPAEINAGQERLLPTPEVWQRCMVAALKELLNCNAIALIPGWEESKGALIEYELAKALGFQIINLFPEELIL